MQVRRVLRILKQPYSELVNIEDEPCQDSAELSEAQGATVSGGGDSDGGAGEKSKMVSVLSMYTSRPPDWALGLCVT